MTDHRLEGPGEHPDPVPRDMPDQQAHEGDDPWEVAAGHAGGDERDEGGAGEDADVPDTDEAGTGRRGEARSGAVHPEQPVPDEPSG
ncbi:hypothetical protein ACFY4I_26175 [Streptomyces scabiei]|uniref:hypothetical protein n=1 Tax=Streptomyces scabiei TaxID=1930 RepID=UPI0036A8E43B